jgi:hypothetical protein
MEERKEQISLTPEQQSILNEKKVGVYYHDIFPLKECPSSLTHSLTPPPNEVLNKTTLVDTANTEIREKYIYSSR